eukprot:COSAG01_NODE_2540_length_7478_cov_13.257759_3_plen_128_part_00
MILMGTYWYKRMKYLLEFAEIMKDSYEDNQIGANLKDLQRNKELFESDCLLEYVDYHGFHKGWNYGASNFNSGKQAKKAHRIVKFHKRCLTRLVAWLVNNYIVYPRATGPYSKVNNVLLPESLGLIR